MKLQYLNEFIVLAQTQNFLEAADVLFLSQSSLSRHIKGLEDELGVPLFKRTTRKVYLTKYGQLLLPYAHRISDQFEQFARALAAEESGKGIYLRIGTIPAMSMYGIGAILRKFMELYGDKYQLNLISSHTASVSAMEMLRRGDCELAFVREESFGDDDVERIPLTAEHVVAVVPKNHPYASLTTLPLSTLAHEDIVTVSKKTTIYDSIHSACAMAGFSPNVVMSDHNPDPLIECILLGAGIGLLLENHIDPSKDYYHDISVLPVEPPIVSHVNLCYLKRQPLSAAANDFVKLYRQWIAERKTPPRMALQ